MYLPKILFFAFLCLVAYLPVRAQYFSRYQVWTSENCANIDVNERGNIDRSRFNPVTGRFLYPPVIATSSLSTSINYEDIQFVLGGDLNGDGRAEAVFLLKDDEGMLRIYTVERSSYTDILVSAGHEKPDTSTRPWASYIDRVHPFLNHHKPSLVNRIEGLALDSGRTDTDDPYNQASTIHPTVFRGAVDIRADQIEFVCMGRFDTGRADEIILLYRNAGSLRLRMLSAYFLVPGKRSLAYSLRDTTIITGGLNSAGAFAAAGDYDGDGSEEIAILDTGLAGIQSLGILEKSGGRWQLRTIPGPLGNTGSGKILFANSGSFSESGRDRLAIISAGPDSTVNDLNIFLSGEEWRFTQVFGATGLGLIDTVVTGDYDGNGLDELAMLSAYSTNAADRTAVQKLLVTDHRQPRWSYSTAWTEQGANLDPGRVRRVFAGNLDGDIRERDDLGMIYMSGQEEDGQDRSDDKMLVWLALPPYSENPLLLKQNTAASGSESHSFFPIGWYDYGMEERLQSGTLRRKMQSYRDRGYNLLWLWRWDGDFPSELSALQGLDAQTTAGVYRSYLDTARAYGISLALDLNYRDYSIHGKEWVQEIIGDLDAHPALWSWFIADEPDLRPLSSWTKLSGELSETLQIDNRDSLDALYRIIKASDSLTPVSQVFWGISYGPEYYRDSYDIAMADGYPHDMIRPLYTPFLVSSVKVHNMLESAIRYNKQGVLFIAQGFKNPELPGSPGYRDIRYNCFAPVIAGARGLLYYSDNESDDTLRAQIDLVTAELRGYTATFMSRPLWERISCSHNRFIVNDFNYADPRYRRDTVLELRGGERRRLRRELFELYGTYSRYSQVIDYSFHLDSASGSYYLFAVNNLARPVDNVEFSLFTEPGEVFLVNQSAGGERSVTAVPSTRNSNWGYTIFRDSFGPHEVRIYTVGKQAPGGFGR